MRAKSLALLVLALGCGLVASIGITQVMSKRDAKPETPTADSQTVFVAMEDLSMGEILTSQILRLEQWPKDKVPVGALTKIEDVEGRRTKTRLYEGEPILEKKLYGKGDATGGVAVRIPKGYRAVPVKVDDVSGGADMILPGDRVDVVVYLTPSRSNGIERPSTRTLLEDIKVFAVDSTVDIDSRDEDEQAINAKTISLLVTPEQAAKVTLASQLGKIMLVMRSPDDDQMASVPAMSLEDLFGGSEKGEREEDVPKFDGEEGDDFAAWLDGKRNEVVPEQPVAPSVSEVETFEQRLWSGSELSYVMLEADTEESEPGPGRWRVTFVGSEADAIPAADTPGPNQPSVEEEPIVEEEPSVEEEPTVEEEPQPAEEEEEEQVEDD